MSKRGKGGLVLPGLVAVKPGGKDAVEISAGADEEEHHQKKRLELENAEHFFNFLSRSRDRFSSEALALELAQISFRRTDIE
ncbi:hypothetical protein KC359_g30 [Hortaea werneckii]|nr:hypothetical protein KC359_g30 [Hortaea werneckii]KAI7514799.1 hypothetical protein KC347_g31 [Hortaea werneckii]